MKGGDITIRYNKTSDGEVINYKRIIDDTSLITLLAGNFYYVNHATETVTLQTFEDGNDISIALTGSGKFSQVCKIIRISDDKPYVIKFTDVTIPKILSEEMNGRTIHTELSDKQKEPEYEGQTFVPDLLTYINQEDELLITIEEDGGKELFDYIITDEKSVNIDKLIQMAECISFMHNIDLVHNDIKLENFIIDENGHIKIIDFGFAIKLNQDTISTTRTTGGTAPFMAPEVLCKKPIDNIEDFKKRDVYSFGLTLAAIFVSNRSKPFDNVDRYVHRIHFQKIIRSCCGYDDEYDVQLSYGKELKDIRDYTPDMKTKIAANVSKRPTIDAVIKQLEGLKKLVPP